MNKLVKTKNSHTFERSVFLSGLSCLTRLLDDGSSNRTIFAGGIYSEVTENISLSDVALPFESVISINAFDPVTTTGTSGKSKLRSSVYSEIGTWSKLTFVRKYG